jgi:hypothetical protein
MKFSGNVLALDIATTTGWAHGKPGSVPTFGSIRFGKAGGARGNAYRQMRTWLDLFCSAHATALVVFESPAVPMIMHGRTNIDTVKLLVGFAEHLEEWAQGVVELREASVQQVRSHFIGRNFKSLVAKGMTIERCRSLGWAVNNSDEADACALWDYQICHLRPDLAARTTPLFAS